MKHSGRSVGDQLESQMLEDGIPLALAAYLTWDLIFPGKRNPAVAEVAALRAEMAEIKKDWASLLEKTEQINAAHHKFLRENAGDEADDLRDDLAMMQTHISGLRAKQEGTWDKT